MRVRDWWEQVATLRDQDAVLYHVQLDRDLAGMPWPFLPEVVREILTRRVRIKPSASLPPEQRSQGGEAYAE